ncbi:MAG: hypothetical protein D6815_09085 [Candidatus Dadabacteria bacterium]|nr:MAG: hypothetical protein D6815_09085 [Candidatus Dadabacteria bacterium]
MATDSALLKSFSQEADAIEERFEEEARRATEPDPTLEQEPLEWTPERALMLAILEDAIACYRKTLKRPRQNPEILARQAEFWFRLEDWDSPFSFNNICEALRLDPKATRERILASRDRRTDA